MSKLKTFFILLGDIAIFYASLALSLYLRRPSSPSSNFESFFQLHLMPFSLILVLWIFVFYLADLYNPRDLKNNFNLFKTFGISVIISGALSAIAFYLSPFFGITPKTNLLIFIVVFGILGFFWRYIFNIFNNKIGSSENILFIISQKQKSLAEELSLYLKNNPQLGYKTAYQIFEKDPAENLEKIPQIIAEQKINLIIVPSRLEEKEKISKIIYGNLASGVRSMNFAKFYELIFRKIPLSELEESWFLENVTQEHRIYDGIKRIMEFFLALLLMVVLSPFILAIYLLVKITSRGPGILKQIRIGQNNKNFQFYKFRSMVADHTPKLLDQNSAQITPFGKLLRRTHLDELPQIYNILKGDLSFIGPRPDLLEYYQELKNQILFYEIRTLIKPGVTGWAQVAYPVTITLDQTKERLAYDLYYLKNRSFFLDLIILIKTLRVILTAAGF